VCFARREKKDRGGRQANPPSRRAHTPRAFSPSAASAFTGSLKRLLIFMAAHTAWLVAIDGGGDQRRRRRQTSSSKRRSILGGPALSALKQITPNNRKASSTTQYVKKTLITPDESHTKSGPSVRGWLACVQGLYSCSMARAPQPVGFVCGQQDEAPCSFCQTELHQMTRTLPPPSPPLSLPTFLHSTPFSLSLSKLPTNWFVRVCVRGRPNAKAPRRQNRGHAL
jgi:hypothetical protein